MPTSPEPGCPPCVRCTTAGPSRPSPVLSRFARWPGRCPRPSLEPLPDPLADELILDPHLDIAVAGLVWAHRIDWLYTTALSVDPSSARERVDLVVQGLDTAAVELNGAVVARRAVQHRSYRLDVRDALTDGENTLTATFRSALAHAEEVEGAHARRAHAYPGSYGALGPVDRRVGICTIERVRPDHHGTPFTTSWNGRPVFGKCASWIPDDLFLAVSIATVRAPHPPGDRCKREPGKGLGRRDLRSRTTSPARATRLACWSGRTSCTRAPLTRG